MDGMRERALAERLMVRFVACMVTLLVLSIPLLYYITTQYYVEDLASLVNEYAIENPDIDLEADTIEGLFIQFFSVIFILLVAVLVVMRYVPHRLWMPFRETLEKVKGFRVEACSVPALPHSGTREFDELNATLTSIMGESVKSYRVQKEFTENVSHELQTPLAIVQGKLDNLLQDKDITRHQAEELLHIYQEIRHMSRLSRNLLLLSKIENNQYHDLKRVNLCDAVVALLPRLESLVGGLSVTTHLGDGRLTLLCNETLFESMLSNLVVNAVRHNNPGGMIKISVEGRSLVVANTSDEPPLDGSRVFSRFYRAKNSQKGNGLGLAIVKSICDFHHWRVRYSYQGGWHQFTIAF